MVVSATVAAADAPRAAPEIAAPPEVVTEATEATTEVVNEVSEFSAVVVTAWIE